MVSTKSQTAKMLVRSSGAAMGGSAGRTGARPRERRLIATGTQKCLAVVRRQFHTCDESAGSARRHLGSRIIKTGVRAATTTGCVMHCFEQEKFSHV